MQEPGAQEPAGKAACNSAHGETVTVIVTGTEDAHYTSGPGAAMTAVRLAVQAFAYIPASPGAPGVAWATGDVLPVICEALQTSLDLWDPADEIPDCPACGNTDGLCGTHAANRAMSGRFRDVLKQLGGAQ